MPFVQIFNGNSDSLHYELRHFQRTVTFYDC